MSTTSIGQHAEKFVADYLKNNGHKILATNWRTKICEIDIVSKYHNTVYCCEVRYRKSAYWGSGLESITSRKLKQIKFSAELWAHNNNWNGQLNLLVASVSGYPFILDDLIEI